MFKRYLSTIVLSSLTLTAGNVQGYDLQLLCICVEMLNSLNPSNLGAEGHG